MASVVVEVVTTTAGDVRHVWGSFPSWILSSSGLSMRQGLAEQNFGSCRNEAIRRVLHINGRASLLSIWPFSKLSPHGMTQDTRSAVDLLTISCHARTSSISGRAAEETTTSQGQGETRDFQLL